MIRKLFLIIAIFSVVNCNILVSQENIDIYKEKLNGKELTYLKNRAFVTFRHILNSNDISNIEKALHIKILAPLLDNTQSIRYSVKSKLELMSLKNQEILLNEEPLLRTYNIEFNSNNPNRFIENLKKKKSLIKYIEKYELPQFLYKPNDPRIDSQIFLNLINAFDLWDSTKGNEDIIIGISDSGVEQNHEDLKDKIAINSLEIPYDMIDNDHNGYIDDYNGYNFAYLSDGVNPSETPNNWANHGQQVAGIAGASTNNAKGIAGVGFNSKIFPIKITVQSNLVYAYQSIIYAATRGVKVLNLSWGSVKAPSDIDQLIINYAISRDVAIVASAGNVGSSGGNTYSSFYPATYKGVLGVGEVSATGNLTSASVLGVGTRIMAPGEGNYTTESGSSYAICDGGSSFSAPVVSGALALARAKYPELDAVQSIEFIRQCADTFITGNSKYYKLTPGILNMKKIVELNPKLIPGIRPDNFIYSNSENILTERFKEGDIANLKIKCQNFLGSASNLKFVLSRAYDPSGSVDIIDSVVELAWIDAKSSFDLDKFKIGIKSNNSEEIILRVDIYGADGYRDFFKFGFVPYKQITTFRNENFFLSLADNGQLGYYTATSDIGVGNGLGCKDDGNQIYKNGTLMISGFTDDDKPKVVYNDWTIDKYDFEVIKGFTLPNQNIGILNDNSAGQSKLNVEVKQEVEFPSTSSNSIRIKLSVSNIGTANMNNLAIGYFVDWDIANMSDSNTTYLFPYALPDDKVNKGVVQAAMKDSQYPIYGVGAVSDELNINPQGAGINYDYFQDFDDAKRFATLNSGTSIQLDNSSKDDIATVVGIRFNGTIAPDESKECLICFARGNTQNQFVEEMKNCLKGLVSVNDKQPKSIIFPNPAESYISFNTSSNENYIIYSILGNILIKGNAIIGNNTIDISELGSGIYIIKIGNKVYIFIKQ